MNTHLIVVSWSDWVKDARVERVATRSDAERHCDAMPPDRSAIVVDATSPDAWSELDRYRGRQLHELYVALGAKPVASGRFTNYGDGRRRIETLIERLAKEAALVDSPKPREDGEMDEYEGATGVAEAEESETEGAERRTPKLGQFKPARAKSSLGEIYAAAEAGKTLAQIARSIGTDVETVERKLKLGRRTHGVDYGFDELGRVSLIFPEGAESAVKASAEREGPPRRRAARSGGGFAGGKSPEPDWHPVRAGTVREAIVVRMDGTRTPEQIAAEVGKTPANTKSHIFCLWRDCGLGYSIDGEGRVSLRMPDGASSSDAVKGAEAA